MPDDKAPSDYVAELIREGRPLEAVLASHVERCFLYGCAHPVGKTHCPYCGRFISATPPRGFLAQATASKPRDFSPLQNRWVCKRCGKARRRDECLSCGNKSPLTNERRHKA